MDVKGRSLGIRDSGGGLLQDQRGQDYDEAWRGVAGRGGAGGVGAARRSGCPGERMESEMEMLIPGAGCAAPLRRCAGAERGQRREAHATRSLRILLRSQNQSHGKHRKLGVRNPTSDVTILAEI